MPSTSGDASDIMHLRETMCGKGFQCPQHRAMHLTNTIGLPILGEVVSMPSISGDESDGAVPNASERGQCFNALNIGR